MMLNLGYFRKKVRNPWQGVKSGAGEGWRRSVGTSLVKNEAVLHRVKEERNILHTIKRRKAD
jgi:hypothetical protein